jgi:hypothetical protein
MGKFVYKIECKWESEVTETVKSLEEMREEEL